MGNPYPAEFEDGSGQVRLAGSIDFTDAGNQPGGGGSQTFKRTDFDFAFDTPNLAVQSFPVTASNVPAQTVTIAGDHRTLFPAGSTASVVGGGNGISSAVVESVAFTGGNTVVTFVAETFSDPVDGTLQNLTTAGVTAYTPVSYEIPLLVQIFIPAAWVSEDQALVNLGYPDDQSAIGNWDLWTPDDNYDAHLAKANGGLVLGFGSTGGVTNGQTWRFRDTEPIILQIIGQNTLADPVATAGTAKVVLLTVPPPS